MKRFLKCLSCSFVSYFLCISSLYADESQLLQMLQNFQGQMAGMQQQIRGLQQTVSTQNEVIAKLQKNQIEIKGSESSQTRISEPSLNLKEKISEPTPGLSGLKFSGDLRLRYEAQDIVDSSTTVDRNRFRYRLRFGFEKEFNEEMKVGVRLASGDLGGVTTRNSSFDTQFDLKNIGIDRVYATYMPQWAERGPISGLEITVGKFQNPFEEGSTFIVWDDDVTPEGIYEKLNIKLLDKEAIKTDGVLTTGQMVVEEGASTNHDDAELFAYQGGFKSEFKNLMEKPVTLKNMISYYDYSDIAAPGNFGSANGNFTTAAGTRLAAEDFNLIEFYNELGFQVGPLPKSKVFFDWVSNLGENADDFLGGEEDKAWSVGSQIGSAKKKGGWEVNYTYALIETNSVPGIFNDGDFGNSDKRGSKVRLAYGLTDYLTVRLTGYFTNNVLDGHPNRTDAESRAFHADMIWQF